MIKFETQSVDFPAINVNEVKNWIARVVNSFDLKCGAITFMFCDDATILEINNKFLQHNYFTDIITFDYSSDQTVSGDLYISLDTVLSNSLKFGSKYGTELHRVIIHGILHLCGQDDKNETDKAAMTSKENAALLLLNLVE